VANKPRSAAIADAVVAEMEAGTWLEPFAIARVYNETKPKRECDNFQISVMYQSTPQKLNTRSKRERRHTILIGMRKNVNFEDDAAVDEAAAFAEQVADYWAAGSGGGLRRIAGTTADVTEMVHDPICAADQLDGRLQFFSLVTLSVLEITAIP
jgi:hypothetical protein